MSERVERLFDNAGITQQIFTIKCRYMFNKFIPTVRMLLNEIMVNRIKFDQFFQQGISQGNIAFRAHRYVQVA